MLSSSFLLGVIALYFVLLYVVSHFTSKQATNETFFLADKQSSWVMVAIGMIGATLSGVTFISIPGVVGDGGVNQSFSYMQMVFGYMVGYFIIATVLMPIYYKYNLTTIYTYLEKRFGKVSRKTGSGFFMLSRIIGAALRLYLVAIVFQTIIGSKAGIPFWLIVALTIALIWVYTFRGGIKTIVWTDTLQTACMVIAVVVSIWVLSSELNISIFEIPTIIKENNLSQWFYFENGWSDPNNFYKQFISGALMALVMTGLDQDMMQKNLTCRSLKEAQMNMGLFSFILIFANILFLSLGAMLYIYANSKGIEIPEKTDQLYPILAIEHLGPVVAVTFVLGMIAAAYSSADSALTALTTAFCVDFLNFESTEIEEEEKKRKRIMVHVGFSLILFCVILAFNSLNNKAVITGLFTAAGYTYGPILGLFTFGILHKVNIRDHLVWVVCLLCPILSYAINLNSAEWLGGLEFGFLILAVNGLLTYLGLWIISIRNSFNEA